MKVLVTGAKGFIGKNLTAQLRNMGNYEIYEFDTDTSLELLEEYCDHCDFVFHLAGVNRPKEEAEFMEGNFGFTSQLLDALRRHHNSSPVMLASSIQAELDNSYGRSKKAGEELLFGYGRERGVKVWVYRFPNVFGKWCRPNYNSAVATFCYNIARDLPVRINDPEAVMNLVYIDDVVEELIRAMEGTPSLDEEGFCHVPVVHSATVGEIARLIYSFRRSREERDIPDMTEGGFVKKMYSTYLSYLPDDSFGYPLKMNVDERGSFTEIIRTPDRGQFSVNIAKPGITKGDHWHHTKNEKFVVVSGTGLIKLRKVGTDPGTGEPYPVVEYPVSGDKMTVVDMIPGCIHNIINTSDTEDLVTFMWCNECFNPEHPDTFYEKV